MSEERQHRTALVYTIIFFGLVAVLSYWYLFQVSQIIAPPNSVPLDGIKLDLTTLFGQ